MILRTILAVAAALLVGLGTIALWGDLKKSGEAQIARIAEAEAYAARSQLVRNVDTMLAAAKSVRSFWAAFGHLPREEWAMDADVELEHFKGIQVIVWDDPERGKRYARTNAHPDFDYTPDAAEWQSYAELLRRARAADGSAILGPFGADPDRMSVEIVVKGVDPDDAGIVAARVSVAQMLDAFLADASPGFAVRVTSGDEVIYARGEAAADLPASWTPSGYIRSSFDSLWKVTHSPTHELVATLQSPAADLILLLGLIVGVLMGTLIFENGRAMARAADAEVAEARVSELNRGLERAVAQRTKELAQRSSDLQMLTDSVAHDLRNPLNAIAMNAQLLEAHYETQLDSGGARALRRMMPSVRQMSEVLDRLMGLSRVANATFTAETLDMRELVAETFDDLGAIEPPPPIQFELAELPEAVGDRAMIQMLYMNLLGNALKYTRDQDPRVVRAGYATIDGDTAYFVADNGPGFDPNVADRIFAAFTQLQDDDDDDDGVGLGLTLARRVARRHGGRIWARSEPGEGATFYFTLGKIDKT